MTLLTLAEAAQAPADRVGGKARGLVRLAASGLPVPPALVVSAEAHERWQRSGGLDPRELREWWERASGLGSPLAVRSSAADEDGGERSAAGQYESVMGVRDEAGLGAAVEHCFRAVRGERASAYRADGEPAAVALVVQREILADRAGVAFSVNPVDPSRRTLLIEAVFGHGEGIVSGEIAPDRFHVDRQSGAVHARLAVKAARADGRGNLLELAPQRRVARTLRDDEVTAVAQAVLEAENAHGAPVDIEFCFQATELWLLQCRPITTLRDVA